MNNQPRRVYQPLMENVPIYDIADDAAGDDDERSRLPLLIVVALIVLAAFGGVVWVAYNQGVARGRASAGVVIAAPEGPVRTAPQDAGGTSTPYTGLKVYGQPIPPGEEAQASALASNSPPPPAAVGDPLRPAAAPDRVQAEPPRIRLNLETAPIVGAETAPSASNPASQAAAKSAPQQASKSAVQAVSAPAPAVRTAAPAATPAAPPVNAAATPPQVRTASAVSAPAAKPATDAAVSASPAGASGIMLQVGSYDNEAMANDALRTLKNRFGDVIGSFSENIQKADIAGKGTFYRLRIGPFADRAEAGATCAKLKAQGGNCIIAAP